MKFTLISSQFQMWFQLNATIKLGSKTYKSKIKKEKYSIKIPKQKVGTKIIVKITDNGGNVVQNALKVTK